MKGELDKAAKQFAWDGGLGTRDRAPVIVDVVKWTATQVVIKDRHGKERRFRIKDGGEVGGRYGSRLEPVTPKVMETIQKERYADAITATAYKIEAVIRSKIAHNPKLQRCQLAKLQLILKGLKEQHALIEDWQKAIDNPEGHGL